MWPGLHAFGCSATSVALGDEQLGDFGCTLSVRSSGDRVARQAGAATLTTAEATNMCALLVSKCALMGWVFLPLSSDEAPGLVFGEESVALADFAVDGIDVTDSTGHRPEKLDSDMCENDDNDSGGCGDSGVMKGSDTDEFLWVHGCMRLRARRQRLRSLAPRLSRHARDIGSLTRRVAADFLARVDALQLVADRVPDLVAELARDRARCLQSFRPAFSFSKLCGGLVGGIPRRCSHHARLMTAGALQRPLMSERACYLNATARLLAIHSEEKTPRDPREVFRSCPAVAEQLPKCRRQVAPGAGSRPVRPTLADFWPMWTILVQMQPNAASSRSFGPTLGREWPNFGPI